MNDLLWVSRPSNRKTGRVPTAYVGKTKEQARETCKGCPQLPTPENKAEGNGGCYAWGGTPTMGFASVLRAHAKDSERYTLESALAARHAEAKMARIGALGDPGHKSIMAETLAAEKVIRAEGLNCVGYTHHWRKSHARKLRGALMASCDKPSEASEALAKGFRPAVIVPADTQGKRYAISDNASLLVCPAQQAEKSGAKTGCNECTLCDPSDSRWDRLEARGVVGIAFVDHSPKVNAAKRSAKAKAKRKLPTV